MEADKVGNTWEDDTCVQYCGPEKPSRLRGKRKGLSLWNGGKSKRLQTIRVRREEYWNTLQQQKVMKEQLRAQEDRLKSLENKMSALLSTLRENLSQQDLVNILKKATQAEVCCAFNLYPISVFAVSSMTISVIGSEGLW